MARQIAARHTDELCNIKEDIENWHQYFQENANRFEKFRNGVFNSSLSEADIQLFKTLQMPQLEANMGEAYLSRLRGEFAQSEPGLTIRGKISKQQLETIEGHTLALLDQAKNDNFQFDIYTDMLAGGYSVAEVYTEYENPMSFDQCLRVRRPQDVTLCCFDPEAIESHKGDGRFCAKLHPKSLDSVTDEFGSDATKDFKVGGQGNLATFSWSYAAYDEPIVLVAEYYKKKKKKMKIVKLVTGHTITEDEYEQVLQIWKDKQYFTQPPAVKGKARVSEIDCVEKNIIMQNKMLDHESTIFRYLPLVFFDGNSQMLKENLNGGIKQMTRPFLWHTVGLQKLKNYSLNLAANALENSVRGKLMVPKKGIPPEFVTGFTNFQNAQTIVYNSHDPANPEIQLPPPMPIPQTPMQPETLQIFGMLDQSMQMVLGSFDSDLARAAQNQMSGEAMDASITLSNSGARPVLVNYFKSLNQIANIFVDLYPKIYTDERSIPVYSKKKGAIDHQDINGNSNIKMDYDSNLLSVKIEAGVNFELQREMAFKNLLSLMKVSPVFQQFINTKGLKWLLDNIDMRGIDQLREEADAFMKMIDQQQQQQMKAQANMPNPETLKMQIEQGKLQQQAQKQQQDVQIAQMKLQQDAAFKQAELQQSQQKIQIEGAIKAAQIHIQQQQVQNDQFKTMASLDIEHQEALSRMDKAEAQKERAEVDLAISLVKLHDEKADQGHKHVKETVELVHKGIELHHKIQEQKESKVTGEI